MSSKKYRKRLREAHIKRMLPQAVWLYYRNMEIKAARKWYIENISAVTSISTIRILNGLRRLNSYYGVPSAFENYIEWSYGLGDHHFDFYYPKKQKVRARNIMCIER